jgi:hypothetical protein
MISLCEFVVKVNSEVMYEFCMWNYVVIENHGGDQRPGRMENVMCVDLS